MKIAVVGAHLRGQPLYWQLEQRNARLLAVTRTKPVYRLFALPNTTPAKPGLLRSAEPQARGIEVELYDMDPQAFASFVDQVPPPLSIGNIELEIPETVKGFLVESYAVDGATEITHLGGWRGYLATLK